MKNQSKIEDQKSQIAVVGAGPAGASLAIRLAQKNFRVTLIERERFPREKLCGEFVSPECFRHFRELDVDNQMFSAGGSSITKTVFYEPRGKNVSVPSEWFNSREAFALSLSRAAMDFHLLKKARELNVEVLENSSVTNLLLEKDIVRGVKVKSENGAMREIVAGLTIDATGRTRVLTKLLKKSKSKIQNPKSKIQNPLVGFKAHLNNVGVEKDACEIYFFRGGYGGLSRVENNLANFCFLLKAEIVREFNSDVRQIIEKVIFQNERASDTLQCAEAVHDWLAVSVEDFGRRELNPARNLFAVGDAGAFIDPFTGSGMLMAFESAEILAKSIGECSTAEQMAARYKSEHAKKFQKRLLICSLLRRAAFAPSFAKFFISALSFGNLPRKWLAQATRPRFSP